MKRFMLLLAMASLFLIGCYYDDVPERQTIRTERGTYLFVEDSVRQWYTPNAEAIREAYNLYVRWCEKYDIEYAWPLRSSYTNQRGYELAVLDWLRNYTQWCRTIFEYEANTAETNWQKPTQFWKRQRGACDDFSMFHASFLIHAGCPYSVYVKFGEPVAIEDGISYPDYTRDINHIWVWIKDVNAYVDIFRAQIRQPGDTIWNTWDWIVGFSLYQSIDVTR